MFVVVSLFAGHVSFTIFYFRQTLAAELSTPRTLLDAVMGNVPALGHLTADERSVLERQLGRTAEHDMLQYAASLPEPPSAQRYPVTSARLAQLDEATDHAPNKTRKFE